MARVIASSCAAKKHEDCNTVFCQCYCHGDQNSLWGIADQHQTEIDGIRGYKQVDSRRY